ncbi:MAG: helix-turn-helix domain-containing protein [Xanthomonadales bacterium]|nr:helix-turn-helix domain-containing protein [Xanthomonadales bacterium]
MKTSKREALQGRGWRFGSVEQFLNLSAEEAAYIELKLALSESLKQRRTVEKLSQVEVARIIHSSQSRVAKMEAGDPTVSLDLLIRSLLALGASRRDLASVIGT